MQAREGRVRRCLRGRRGSSEGRQRGRTFGDHDLPASPSVASAQARKRSAQEREREERASATHLVRPLASPHLAQPGPVRLPRLALPEVPRQPAPGHPALLAREVEPLEQGLAGEGEVRGRVGRGGVRGGGHSGMLRGGSPRVRERGQDASSSRSRPRPSVVVPAGHCMPMGLTPFALSLSQLAKLALAPEARLKGDQSSLHGPLGRALRRAWPTNASSGAPGSPPTAAHACTSRPLTGGRQPISPSPSLHSPRNQNSCQTPSPLLPRVPERRAALRWSRSSFRTRAGPLQTPTASRP